MHLLAHSPVPTNERFEAACAHIQFLNSSHTRLWTSSVNRTQLLRMKIWVSPLNPSSPALTNSSPSGQSVCFIPQIYLPSNRLPLLRHPSPSHPLSSHLTHSPNSWYVAWLTISPPLIHSAHRSQGAQDGFSDPSTVKRHIPALNPHTVDFQHPGNEIKPSPHPQVLSHPSVPSIPLWRWSTVLSFPPRCHRHVHLAIARPIYSQCWSSSENVIIFAHRPTSGHPPRPPQNSLRHCPPVLSRTRTVLNYPHIYLPFSTSQLFQLGRKMCFSFSKRLKVLGAY